MKPPMKVHNSFTDFHMGPMAAVSSSADLQPSNAIQRFFSFFLSFFLS